MGKKLKKSAIFALVTFILGIGSAGLIQANENYSYKDILAQSKNKDRNVRTVTGRVVEMGSDSLKIKRGQKTYEVKNQGAPIMDRNGKEINFGDIKTGDRLLVRGKISGSSIIDVIKIRDISIPR